MVNPLEHHALADTGLIKDGHADQAIANISLPPINFTVRVTVLLINLVMVSPTLAWANAALTSSAPNKMYLFIGLVLKERRVPVMRARRPK